MKHYISWWIKNYSHLSHNDSWIILRLYIACNVCQHGEHICTCLMLQHRQMFTHALVAWHFLKSPWLSGSWLKKQSPISHRHTPLNPYSCIFCLVTKGVIACILFFNNMDRHKLKGKPKGRHWVRMTYSKDLHMNTLAEDTVCHFLVWPSQCIYENDDLFDGMTFL